MIRVFRIRGRYLLLLLAVILLAFFMTRVVVNGLENRKVATLSWTVANKLIVIDPGHGGIDPGAKGPGGVVEKDVTLEVSRKLATVLGQYGAVVILTRDADMDLSSSQGEKLITRKREDLARRVGMANDRNADAFISVHVNSFKSGPREHGAQTFYQPGCQAGEKLAKCIQSELVRLLGNTKRKEKAVDYYTTRHAKVPAVIVEIGFISNAREEKLISNPDYQGKLAYAIGAGVVKYFADAAAVDGPLEQEGMLNTFINNKGHVPDAP